MTISRMTVDKLGAKLYDKVSAVMAELIANSYDADATEVEIVAPMGVYLATMQGSNLTDRGFAIEISDNGTGMTPDEVNTFYLRVGGERRTDPKRGDISKRFGRKVMGRKGVGKLAPFGICERIEVLTSGGQLIDGKDKNGKKTKGYLTAHLILDRKEILSDEAVDYHPQLGTLDGTVSLSTGTRLTLSQFAHRQVPPIDEFARQMAQRFGIASSNWKIKLMDLIKSPGDPDCKRTVGSFDVAKMPGTELFFVPGESGNSPQIITASSELLPGLNAGFLHDGRFYPITGWIAYSRDPYKDDLMAGVRIYCRGKIASQTSVFNRGAGFQGEYSVRSYLIGELHTDWLDEEEDLIQTDRRDILWSSDLGVAFEKWGQQLVSAMGKLARNPLKKKTFERFSEISQLDTRIQEAFPLPDQEPIRERAREIAKLIGQTIREDELGDPEYSGSLVQLTLTLAPHITLDMKLKEAGNAGSSPLSVINGILKTARIAELSSFGLIADDRVRIILRLEQMKNEEHEEAAFQELISQAPWLIDPQWSPITANQTFTTLKREFEQFYFRRTGEQLHLGNFSDSNKRPDFVLSSQDRCIQIIEIKQPAHRFEDVEMVRLDRYVKQMDAFLSDLANAEFTKSIDGFHVTLVCDAEKLTGVYKTAFDGLIHAERLTLIGWSTFLLRTKQMHQSFLDEAERQKHNATQE